MKSWKIITIATLSVLAVALLFSTVAAMGPFGSNLFGGYGGMMGGGYGGGMGGYGYGPYTNPQNPSQINSLNYQAAFPFQFGGGCIGRFGYNNYVAPNLNTGTGPITIDTAVTVAQNYDQRVWTQTDHRNAEPWSQSCRISLFNRIRFDRMSGSAGKSGNGNDVWMGATGNSRPGANVSGYRCVSFPIQCGGI